MPTLVIRFSSLGDIVLCAAITQHLAPVTFVTKERYRELAASLPGVESVCCPPNDPLPSNIERIVDLHNNLRSWRYTFALRVPCTRVQRYDIKRRMRVAFKVGKPPPKVIERYAQAANGPISPKPWLSPPQRRNNLVVCPTTQHFTKAWDPERYAQIIQRWNGSTVLLGSASERTLLMDIARISQKSCHIVAENGFVQTLDILQDARLALGGDTGLMHLCGAMDIPLVMLFGPTTSEDGFWCHRGIALEVERYCRPCSRFGSVACPIGDHACMCLIDVDQVWAAVQKVSA
ncbi:MAG: glycosyltransferase family 9 protein [Myxococcota bacterium]|nr:glycosyltransferase family 9 protein [Myxococcota bacterium]